MLLGSKFRSDQATGQGSSTVHSFSLFWARQSLLPPRPVEGCGASWWCIVLSLVRFSSLLSLQPFPEAPIHRACGSPQSSPLQLPVPGASSSSAGIAHRSAGSLSLVLCLLMMLGLSPAFSFAYLSCSVSPSCTCSPRLAFFLSLPMLLMVTLCLASTIQWTLV